MSIGISLSRKLLRTQPDQRLVELIRRGHDDAFEEVVRRYRDPLVAFAAAIVPHAIAEEVVQSGLARAHDRLVADTREIKLRPWLFTVVRNGALNAYAAERPHSELGDELSGGRTPMEAIETSDELASLITGILALPDNQRQAIVRREVSGEGYGEIAAALTTTPTAVRGLIFRARTALRESMGLLVPLPLLQLGLPSGGGAVPGALAGAAGGVGSKAAAVTAAAALAIGGGAAIQGGALSGQANGAGSPGNQPHDGGGPGGSDQSALLKAKEEDATTLEEIEEDEDGPDPRGDSDGRESGGGGNGNVSGAGGSPGGSHDSGGGGGSGPGAGTGIPGGGSGGETTGGHSAPSVPSLPDPATVAPEQDHSRSGGGATVEAPTAATAQTSGAAVEDADTGTNG